MLDIDISLLIQLVNFFVLLFVLNAILYRPLRKIMADRREKVAGLEREIEGLTKNANQKLEDFKAKLKEANLRGNKEREALRNEGLTEEKNVTLKARGVADAYKQQTMSEIEQDVAKVREALGKQISAFGSEIAGKILGRAI